VKPIDGAGTIKKGGNGSSRSRELLVGQRRGYSVHARPFSRIESFGRCLAIGVVYKARKAVLKPVRLSESEASQPTVAAEPARV